MIKPDESVADSVAPAERAARHGISAGSALDLLKKIAMHPRFTGTVREADAMKLCTKELRALGFKVVEYGFTFSDLPGKWGPPLGAVILAGLAFASGRLATHAGAPLLALGVLLGGSALLAATAAVVARFGPTRLPWSRLRSVNLVATRGSGHPARWLVAHIDSKSQTMPILARVASVAASGLAVALLAGVIAMVAIGTSSASPQGSLNGAILVLSYIAVACTVPLMLCIVGNRSRGALDNASGVVAVLLAVRTTDWLQPVGVILTSGEELGLAGARAYVESNREGGFALNCDTIDDAGSFLCMSKGKVAPKLAAAIARAARTLNVPMRTHRMLPGVYADNVAFTDAGWDSVTISRGNLGTLARVHTARDRLDGIDGTGIAETARLLAATIEELS